ncbi:MAG: DNA-deoxyinosine glycosylase [Oscillospiraceae bacterium]|nr:DNA-deoxyinosine glycosylase [Oscillospiraceae bacterium]
MAQQALTHPIPPTWNEKSRVLILGSFPSAKSREMAYFYGHPQNRFWKVLALLFDEPVPETKEEREAFLLSYGIAVWDVIASCSISGSSDSSIRDVAVNDLSPILNHAPIRQIYVNGRKAESLFRKYIQPQIAREAICLPSTSPANAAWTLEKLLPVWQQILTFL